MIMTGDRMYGHKTKRKRMELAAQREADTFNAATRIGDPVFYTNDFGKTHRTTTASLAFVVDGLRAVVHLHSVHSAVPVCRVKKGA